AGRAARAGGTRGGIGAVDPTQRRHGRRLRRREGTWPGHDVLGRDRAAVLAVRRRVVVGRGSARANRLDLGSWTLAGGWSVTDTARPLLRRRFDIDLLRARRRVRLLRHRPPMIGLLIREGWALPRHVVGLRDRPLEGLRVVL